LFLFGAKLEKISLPKRLLSVNFKKLFQERSLRATAGTVAMKTPVADNETWKKFSGPGNKINRLSPRLNGVTAVESSDERNGEWRSR
jgi:hypothetical protein